MIEDEAGSELTGPPGVGRSLSEKFLLSLIDAYPVPSESKLDGASRQKAREDRLREARAAVFGELAENGRPQDPDSKALRWMGEQRYIDIARGNAARLGATAISAAKERSYRELSKAAAKMFGLEKDFERLRQKFRSEEQYWMDIARYHDDLPETAEWNALNAIAELLGRYGINMIPTKD